MFSEFDRLAMTRALALAELGLETTHPNPRVGCVIAKGERIIAEGWHQRAGQPHAEIMALRAATEVVSGATAYVTLEPCSHFGRTPPCADALIEAKIARVVFAVQDPNPRVSGQGAGRLLQAGVAVESGLMQVEATELNIGFMRRMRDGRPWVRVKLAMSLDGRTALANGSSQWITGGSARADVQRWRARSSAVMTGVGTVLADDPRLNVRSAGKGGLQPLRVVLDSQLRTSPAARVLGVGQTTEPQAVAGPGLLIFAAAHAAQEAGFRERRAELEARGVRIMEVSAQDGLLELPAVLAHLGELEVNELLVEAGPILAGQFLGNRLVDELLLYVAPKLLGPQGRPLACLPELHRLEQAWGFMLLDTTQLGEDLRLRMRPN